MTLYLSFRSDRVGGSVTGAKLIECDEEGDPLNFKLSDAAGLAPRAQGRDILFATHGFNVNRDEGIRSLGRLGKYFNPGGTELFVGVLWPGDFWIPVVNYPFAGGPAIAVGKLLADFCNKQLAGARSISFVSHSLGARVVLQAAARLAKPARMVCVTAGAVNDTCLTAEYAAAAKPDTQIPTLSSRGDRVLRLAYPVGDLIGDLLQRDHALGEVALGRNGPRLPVGRNILPSEIPDSPPYDHGDYLPPSDQVVTADTGKWTKVADYIKEIFRNTPPNWPPPA